MDTPNTSYFICTNPRSGSWLLGEGLALTSVAGNPREWFQEEEERDQCAKWGIEHSADGDYAEYLSNVYRDGSTGNGIFGGFLPDDLEGARELAVQG